MRHFLSGESCRDRRQRLLLLLRGQLNPGEADVKAKPTSKVSSMWGKRVRLAKMTEGVPSRDERPAGRLDSEDTAHGVQSHVVARDQFEVPRHCDVSELRGARCLDRGNLTHTQAIEPVKTSS